MNIERNAQWCNDTTGLHRLHGRFGLRLRGWLAKLPVILLTDVPVLLLALTLFLWSGPLLRLWDATAGVLDVGILSMLPLALLVVALARLAATIAHQSMVESLNQLTVWQRTLCHGCLCLSYFWAVVLVVVALL
ncbi:hypothetical protein [Sinomicrobium weinanense]|uniref:Uncharacterized protein n=1 Tax=Sinomicrobium weinanense TaxID=2842200 RepID=A0A926JUZ3_9FLAO|nr:hypothetical protein [Sinomicrobium weinanense]MBC9797851.1 hypothetical protein [Sinomicrobium weinanense]MBU3122249.1 hypothetical protein [Sinomicrobium weinanense]